jgi:signal transduction histidine kinase
MAQQGVKVTFDQTQIVAPHPRCAGSRLPEGSGSAASSGLEKLLHDAVADGQFRSRLMAMVGHDLKQPLQVAGILLDALVPYIGQHAEAQPRLQLLRESLHRIAEGLDGLALASTVGAHVASLQRFPVIEVLQRIEPTWHEHAARKGIELRIVQSSAMITSDITMLSAILDNLVGNAIKYTSKGHVLIGCRHVRGLLSIQVLDTGVGIRATRLEKIFEAFHQENTTCDGLGLGLCIVHYTAAALGHTVRVASELGKGSVFSVDVAFHQS